MYTPTCWTRTSTGVRTCATPTSATLRLQRRPRQKAGAHTAQSCRPSPSRLNAPSPPTTTKISTGTGPPNRTGPRRRHRRRRRQHQRPTARVALRGRGLRIGRWRRGRAGRGTRGAWTLSSASAPSQGASRGTSWCGNRRRVEGASSSSTTTTTPSTTRSPSAAAAAATRLPAARLRASTSSSARVHLVAGSQN